MKVVLLGEKGMLARKVKEKCPEGWELVGLDLPEFDLTNREQVIDTLVQLKPQVVINCAAYTAVDKAEVEEDLATLVNGTSVGYLAEASKDVGALLVHISTDYIFDGFKSSPYVEDDLSNPLSVYGKSKLVGEEAIYESGIESFFIIRTSWLYGPGGGNFVETMIRLATEREELRVVADQKGCPTYTGDLAAAIYNLISLCEKGELGEKYKVPYGEYHFSNEGECSWFQFAEEIVAQMKDRGLPLSVKDIVPIATDEYPLPAPRPAYSVFSKMKYVLATGATVPVWQEALEEYFSEREC